MKREELEKYLGKMVQIKVLDDDFQRGCLRKCHTEMFKDDLNLYLPKNYYFLTCNETSKICISPVFRCSHVKKLIEDR